MIIRLIIRNKCKAKLSLPQTGNFNGLLSPLETLNYNLSEDEFIEVLPVLEKQVKNNRIEVQVNFEDTPENDSVLNLIKQNSKIIFNGLTLPQEINSKHHVVTSENDISKIYGVIRSRLIKLSVQEIRNTVAEAGFNVSKIPSKSELKTGFGSRAEIMPVVDKLYGEMDFNSKETAISIITEKVIQSSDEKKELNDILKKHGLQFVNGKFVVYDRSDKIVLEQFQVKEMTQSKDAAKLFIYGACHW
jgi:CRISPR/Cas system CMR subunit Cmr4 (Cas7 group RAMP superfamily)